MSNRISGKKIAEKIKKNIRRKVSILNRDIVFSIIYVGEDPVIDNFIRYKKKFGEDVEISVIVYKFNGDIKEKILISEIENISEKSDAVIVQLPLPLKLNTQKILNSVPTKKDVDVLSENAKLLFAEGNNSMLPPVTGAIIEVLNRNGFVFGGKNIVIIGYGDLVGRPFGVWLERNNIDFFVINKDTSEKDKYEYLINADLIVAGAGVQNLIKPYMIKDGVILIDGGTSEAGKKIQGDVDPACYKKALFYTPVPGGVGPITIAILYRNILKTQK